MAIIAAPTKDYSDSEIERLRDWLDNDGKLGRQLMVVVNYQASCPTLYDFLNVEYGLEVTDNLVQETSNNRVYYMNSYYVYGDVGSSDYTGDISGQRVLMPVTRQILTNKENNKQNSLFNVPLATFPESAKLVKMEDALSETGDGEETTKPEAFDADEYPISGAAMAVKWGYDSDNNKIETNILVFGSNQMFLSGITEMSTVYNEELLLSLANGVTNNESTIQISKKPLERTKLEFNTSQAYIFLVVFVIAIPLALLIVCLVVFLRRRRL